MICGHGSREAASAHEFMALVKAVALRLPQFHVQSGFLEFARPSLLDGLEKLRSAGCTRILAVPGTLFSAGHAQRDIPLILQEFAARHPEIQITYGRELGSDPKMVQAATARVREAAAENTVTPDHTALLVAGRGASDRDALAALESITRKIRQELKFAAAVTAYAGIAAPLVTDMLAQIAASNVKRIIVAPYFLFTGTLVKRIYEATDAAAVKNPDIQFLKAGYLNNHPLVIDCLVERILQTADTGVRIYG